MTRIYHTTTIDIQDYEVEVCLDSDDILREMDNDDLIEHVKDDEGVSGIVERIYSACDELHDPLVAHDDACGLAVRIITHDYDRFLAHLNSELDEEQRGELYAKLGVPVPPAAPEGDDVRAFLNTLTTDRKKDALIVMLDESESLRTLAREHLGGGVVVQTMEDAYVAVDKLSHAEKKSLLNHILATIATPQDAVTALIDQNGLDGAITLIRVAIHKAINERLSAAA